MHLSVINAAHDAPTAYFRAKAVVEDALRASGVRHAIVRPTVTFGPGDILVNNLAWTLRRPGVISIPKAADPVHVRENAAAALLKLSEEDHVALDTAFPPPQRKRPLAIL